MPEAEFAIEISNRFQRQGLGTRLLQLLVDNSRQEGLERIFGYILPDNYSILHIAKKVGFTVTFDRLETVMWAKLTSGNFSRRHSFFDQRAKQLYALLDVNPSVRAAALGRFDVKIVAFKTRESIMITAEFGPPGTYEFPLVRQEQTGQL